MAPYSVFTDIRSRDQRKSQKSHAHTILLEPGKTQCSHTCNQLGETRRDRTWKETARRNLLLDKRDQAQSSCIDLRVQGDSDQSTDDEERALSLKESLVKHLLELPNKDKLMAHIGHTRRDGEAPM